MPLHWPNGGNPRGKVAEFYRDALTRLSEGNVPFLIGGGYAVEFYTGLRRRTKDIDVFLLPKDVHTALEMLSENGYRAELTNKDWLAKASLGEEFIDIIFDASNKLGAVDEDWFRYSRPATMLGMRLRVCPPEEMIWHKSFVMSRHRYDGSDVIHLLKVFGLQLDWHRLLKRFGEHWQVLLSHLVLFQYVYPGGASQIPLWVRNELLGRLHNESMAGNGSARQTCRGLLLSKRDYAMDFEQL